MILCICGKADEALQHMREVMSQLKLTVNEEKTRVCKVPDETYNFLGFTFGRMYSSARGRLVMATDHRRKVSSIWFGRSMR